MWGASVERFLGWEPAETHTTTHPDGSVTVTVVTREPEWNDRNREAAYSLYDDEQQRCPDCGQPREVCEQVRDYFPQRTVCWATAARSVARRRFEKLHEHANPDPAGYLPTDGVTVWVSQRDLSPDDDFLDTPQQRAERRLGLNDTEGGDHGNEA